MFGSLPRTIVVIFKQDLLQGSVEKFHEILCEAWVFGLQACWTDVTDSAQHCFSFVVFVVNYIFVTPRWCSDKDVLVCCLHVAFYDLISTNSFERVPESSSTIRGTLTLRRLMSYIYGAPILDVSRSHTTTQHSR